LEQAISVVIPTLDEGDRILSLLNCLDSIDGIRQIVIVDASKFGQSPTVQNKIQTPGHVTRLAAEQPGRARQMNQGARVCSENAILFLHCDSVPPLNSAALIVNALKTCRWGRFELRLDGPGFGLRLIEFMIDLRSRLTRLATGDQGIFIDRDFFLQQGGFAEIALMEDIEFSRRVGKHWPPGLIKTPVSTSSRRWAKNGTIPTIWLMWKLRFLYRMGKSPDSLAAMYHDAR
jgi:rSAM/selenodomain-associated transferase 2